MLLGSREKSDKKAGPIFLWGSPLFLPPQKNQKNRRAAARQTGAKPHGHKRLLLRECGSFPVVAFGGFARSGIFLWSLGV